MLSKSSFLNGRFLLEISKKRLEIMISVPQDAATGHKYELTAKLLNCDNATLEMVL